MSADLLLDTHVALWMVGDDPRWRPLLADAIDDPASTITVSVVSWIEIAIKHASSKLVWGVEQVRETLVSNGFLELTITAGHARALELLPPRHRDPFDRLLIAQAMAEGMTLVSADRAFAAYDGLSLRGA